MTSRSFPNSLGRSHQVYNMCLSTNPLHYSTTTQYHNNKSISNAASHRNHSTARPAAPAAASTTSTTNTLRHTIDSVSSAPLSRIDSRPSTRLEPRPRTNSIITPALQTTLIPRRSTKSNAYISPPHDARRARQNTPFLPGFSNYRRTSFFSLHLTPTTCMALMP